MNANTATLIAQIRAHAEANYEKGLDNVVECYEDEDIAEVIGNARTLRGAIRKFRDLVEHWQEQDAEAAQYREDPVAQAADAHELAVEREAVAKVAADYRAWLDLMYPEHDANLPRGDFYGADDFYFV